MIQKKRKLRINKERIASPRAKTEKEERGNIMQRKYMGQLIQRFRKTDPGAEL